MYIEWYDRENQQSPAPKQLRKPTKVDTALPISETVMPAILDVHQVTQCEKHSFVNSKQRKRMDVYKWSVKYDSSYGRRTAHVLQCYVESLD